jgi:Fe-S-cluster-containing hydrogenase component 2/CRP-like cAMP-binding protein
MAKIRKIVTNPPADLEARDTDLDVPFEKLVQIAFFARLKKAKQTKPDEPTDLQKSLEKFPGTLRVRRFRKGEVICRQGEAGWTAFCILTEADIRALGREPPSSPPPGAVPSTAVPAGAPPANPVATVHLALARPADHSSDGLFARLGRALFGGPRRTPDRKPLYIPIDAPRDVNDESRQATLYEGDLFGEMSCIYGSPRSATVVADRDWYMLEMLRNILDEVQGDPGYHEEMDRIYRERVLQHQLRRLPIFSDLTDEQYERIRDEVDLVRCKVGEIICDEHDRSDSMYIIRSGLVKTVKNASELLSADDIVDWPGLCARLLQGGQEGAGLLGLVWKKLPEALQNALRQTPVPETEGEAVRIALNEFIKDPPLPDPKNPKAIALPPGSPLAAHVAGLPKDPKQWPVAERRRYGRLYLESVCSGLLHTRQARTGLEYVVAYQSKGELIGEMGLMMGRPRSATCVAYVHPEPGQGHKALPSARWRRDESLVELVRIPETTFQWLIQESPVVAEKVRAVIAERTSHAQVLGSAGVLEESRPPLLSDRFEELGLIQGQQLMLIDLDRCTRCDECVKACVNTHGGESRLFLDGPRFGKYLVPTTCRSCLDPVCMIGCPVGSIHRGDNRQIVIEDWCIGCGLCATNCPYGSIQMHDVGLIAEGAHGYRYYPAALLSDTRWTQSGYSDRRWLAGRAPFRNDRDFRATLPETNAGGDGGICFRYEFQVPANVLQQAAELILVATSPEGGATVWVNGKELQTEAKARGGKREYKIVKGDGVLHAGRNVVAVKTLAASKELELVLDLRLDEVRLPDILKTVEAEVSEKLVKERAVVCDLCSDQFGQRPACVNACPHDAAHRVNARIEFPVS